MKADRLVILVALMMAEMKVGWREIQMALMKADRLVILMALKKADWKGFQKA